MHRSIWNCKKCSVIPKHVRDNPMLEIENKGMRWCVLGQFPFAMMNESWRMYGRIKVLWRPLFGPKLRQCLIISFVPLAKVRILIGQARFRLAFRLTYSRQSAPQRLFYVYSVSILPLFIKKRDERKKTVTAVRLLSSLQDWNLLSTTKFHQFSSYFVSVTSLK